jgi:hypothetical protein
MPYATYLSDLKKESLGIWKEIKSWLKSIIKAGPEPFKFLDHCFMLSVKVFFSYIKIVGLTTKKILSIIGLI